MPFTSSVGRDQVISSTERPVSPAGVVRPMSPRNLRFIKVEPLPLRGRGFRQFRHTVIKARNGDVAVGVAHLGQDGGEHVDRVVCSAAIEA
jgi:hypothetical protein